jgi:hypothetical protein
MIKEINFDSIKEFPGFSKVYHDTILLQHHHYYLFNRQHDLERTMEYDKESYYPLNHANFILGKFCKRKISSLPDHMKIQYPELFSTLNQSIDEWQNLYNAGAVFDTCRFAKKILEILEYIGFEVHPEVLAEEGVRNEFLHIPFHTKSYFQLSFTIADNELTHFFEKMIGLLASEPSLNYYIKELKITCKLFANASGNGTYRAIKMSLLPKVVITRLNPVIGTLTRQLTEVLADFGPDCHSTGEFYFPVADRVYLAQGNFNYKLFLQMLGLIDDVYDKSFNYALIKS